MMHPTLPLTVFARHQLLSVLAAMPVLDQGLVWAALSSLQLRALHAQG